MRVVTTLEVPGQRVREHAIDQMVANAAAGGANAVLMMRFESSENDGD